MRQAGFMAAAGIYALQNHIERLEADHVHAANIAAALKQKSFIGNILPVETNILIFEVLAPYTSKSLAEKLGNMGIRCIAISPTQIRFVTHLDISPQQVQKIIETIGSL
jgi:threonine aldolase